MNDFLEQQNPSEPLSPLQEAFVEKTELGQLLPAGSREHRIDARHYLVVVKCGTPQHPQILRGYEAPVFGTDGSRIPSYFIRAMYAIFNKDPQSETYTIGAVSKSGEHLGQEDGLYFEAPNGPRVDLNLMASRQGNRVLCPIKLQYSQNGKLQGIYGFESDPDVDYHLDYREYVSLHHLKENLNPFIIELAGVITAEYDKSTGMVTVKTIDGDETIESLEVPTAVNVEEIKEKLFPHEAFADPWKATFQDDASWRDADLRRAWGIKPSLPPEGYFRKG